MKLSLIYENNSTHEAYHVTDSFHIVKLIFEEGFRTDSGAGRVCMSSEPWDDFGMYVILVRYTEDEWHVEPDVSAETGAKPENCHPIKWGFLFSKDDVVWVGSNVDIDLKKYDKLVRQKIVQYNQKSWLHNWVKDLKATNSKDRALERSFGKSYSYDEIEVDKKLANEILQKLKMTRDAVAVFKSLNMTEAEFKDYLVYLLDSNQLRWSMLDS